MANSIKETKVLLEGFRRFAIKEAEAPAGGETVKIFDFDNTLVSMSDGFKEIGGAVNQFLLYLNEKSYKRACAKLLRDAQKMPAFDTFAKTYAENPNATYIYSMVKSEGFNKKEETFMRYLMGGVDANGVQKPPDEPFHAFLRLIFGIRQTTLDKFDQGASEPVETDDSEDVDYGDEADYGYGDELDEAAKKKVPQEQALEMAKKGDAKAAKALLKKYFTYEEMRGGLERSNEAKIAIKKELIEQMLKKFGVTNFPTDKIIVSDNLAVSKETGGFEAGTSGKRKGTIDIAKSHPNAAGYQIYDNNGPALGQMKAGILRAAKSGGVKGAAELAQKINDLKSKSETETDKAKKRAIDGEIKILDRDLQQMLNIATFSVDKVTGATKEIFNPLTGNSGSGIADPINASRKLENDIFGVITGKNKRVGILTKRKVFDIKNKQAFAEVAAKFPSVAAFINGSIGRKGGKKADAIPGINPIDVTKMSPEEADAALGKVSKELPAFTKAVQEKFPIQGGSDSAEEELPQASDSEEAPKETPEEPSAESIYEELDRLLSIKKYSFNITTKK